MGEASNESPTLRMRRLDGAALEIAEVLRDRRIVTLFQPIVDPRSRGLYGFEALARGPSNSWLHAPQNLFEAARRAGILHELDFHCIDAAFRRFATGKASCRLFLNVSPETIYDTPEFAARLRTMAQAAAMPLGRCVLELTEDSLVEDYRRLRAILQPLRDAGCEIAIDDLGAGTSGLRTWSEIRPDYVKIDRYFITGIDSDPTKHEFVRSIIDMGRAIGSRVLAEGVETEAESRELLELGVDFLQGYFFGRPEPEIRSSAEQTETLERWVGTQTALCAEHLAEYMPPIAPETRVSEVMDLFRAKAGTDAIAVVRDGRPLGVVHREELFNLMNQPLQHDVYGSKPISSVMETPPLMIDSRLRLEQVSRLVTHRKNARLSEQFVIVRGGQYLGMGQTMDLLRQMTDQQVKVARQSNPLTLLPGNVRVRERISRLLAQERRFVLCHIDVDCFKPYNDLYGYSQGDQLILHLAALLKAAASTRHDFLGHLGGDDFIAVLRSADWRRRMISVIQDFSDTIANFYSEEHALAGCIEAPGRDGQVHKFPLLTLSLAALDSHTEGCTSADSAAKLLAGIKKVAKSRKGNSFLLRTGRRVVDLLRHKKTSPEPEESDCLLSPEELGLVAGQRG